MSTRASVAIFCGSNPGNQGAFTYAAQSVGQAIAKSGKTLVYGGGSNGVMGVVSEAALKAGGRVIGVIPYAMVGGREGKYDDGHSGVEKIVVNTMHERKTEIARQSQGFIGLPGGFGTFEEVLEMVTWTQLEIHNKPVIIVNVCGFYDPLRDLIRSGLNSGFIPLQNKGLVIFVDGPADTSTHGIYDWGKDVLSALDSWKRPEWSGYGYDWTKGRDGVKDPIDVS